VCRDHPDDLIAKLVFADWCDKHGEPLVAIALRWMARHKKNPTRFGRQYRWYSNGIHDRDFAPGRLVRQRRMPLIECWLPKIVGLELATRYPLSSRDWFILLRHTGWAIQRIRDLVD
jgi:uncharacterized protein (TIGR02996 family)